MENKQNLREHFQELRNKTESSEALEKKSKTLFSELEKETKPEMKGDYQEHPYYKKETEARRLKTQAIQAGLLDHILEHPKIKVLPLHL